jgi:beta-ureidopropionase / N-carbamoyl-L-amino-acid hydrolase
LSRSDVNKLAIAVDAAMPLAQRLFDDLRINTAAEEGVGRESYGQGEQYAHDLLAETAKSLALETAVDFAGNLYMTLPGSDRAKPGWITGSHLDSVPQGGNFDGAAGVIAAITALAAFRQSNYVPPSDVTVVGIRAEEASSWYRGDHGGHLGSRAVLGMLKPGELDAAINMRTNRTLAEHMREAGFDPRAGDDKSRLLPKQKYKGYLELHIEQGPVLENRGLPVGIVTGIRGSARARNARCIGAYTHSGAVPHEYRSDAVLATAEFCHRLDQRWEEVRKSGGDLVFTVGQLCTDAQAHSITKVPGETRFTLDIRSQDLATIEDMVSRAHELADEIGSKRRVKFDLGAINISEPAVMDAAIQQELAAGADALKVAHARLPSGAGHDAQDFALAGVRAGMIFVRNAHGSHNPHEAMAMADFALGTQLLGWLLLE